MQYSYTPSASALPFPLSIMNLPIAGIKKEPWPYIVSYGLGYKYSSKAAVCFPPFAPICHMYMYMHMYVYGGTVMEDCPK